MKKYFGFVGFWLVVFQLLHIREEFRADKSSLHMDLELYLVQHVPEFFVPILTFFGQFLTGILSLVTIFLLYRLLTMIFRFNRFIFLSVLTVFFAFYFSGQSYLYAVKTNFDFSILAMNHHTMVEPDFFLAALPYVRVMPLLFMIGMILWIWIAELRNRSLSKRFKSYSLKTIGLTLVVWLGLVNVPIKSYDVMASFTKSIFSHFYGVYEQNRSFAQLDSDQYPLISTDFSYSSSKLWPKNKKRPHVFIVMVESFNVNFVESQNTQKKSYTPYFNDLLKQGIYFENFYGNSVQSCKGQFALLTSLIPPVNGFGFRYKTTYLPFTDFMKEAGYHLSFFQASGNLITDNTGGFLAKIGFDDVKSAMQTKTKEDKPYFFKWGLQDSRLYHHFFNYLDAYLVKNPDKPMFAILPTIFTHNNTTPLPKEMRTFYQDPKNSYEHFANVINLTDAQLHLFIDGLKARGLYENSIVIITGDHSRSSGIAEVSVNQFGCHNDIFKVPFLMLWPEKLKPERVDFASSQLDIGPTLLDMLQIPVDQHHFQGQSIFDQSNSRDPIYLVQPYDGIFVSVIDQSLKYVKHLKTKREFIYDLKKDPLETVSVINEVSVQVLEQLRQKAGRILLTTQLIKKDLVFSKH